MKYKFIGDIEAENPFILWKHYVPWLKMILHLLEHNDTSPLISSEFLSPAKAENIKDTETYLQDVSRFILVFLYIEIPFQMGMREINQINRHNKKIFEKERKEYYSCLKNMKDILNTWKSLTKLGIIIDNEEGVAANSFQSLIDLSSIFSDIPNYIQCHSRGWIVDYDIKKVNPFFGRKQNLPTVLRDFVMKYLSFLMYIFKIEFSTAYQKHKCLYQILSKLFANTEYPEFHLMENLQQEDLKNYLNDNEINAIPEPALYFINFIRELSNTPNSKEEYDELYAKKDAIRLAVFPHLYVVRREKPHQQFLAFLRLQGKS